MNEPSVRESAKIAFGLLLLITALILFGSVFFGCTPAPAGECAVYHFHHYQDQFPGAERYPVNVNAETSGGIRVDTSGLLTAAEVADLIERQVTEVESCLAEAFSGGKIAAGDPGRSDCDGPSFPLPLVHECLEVKIAPDALLSYDRTQEVLPSVGQVEQCIAKGQCPAGATLAECPCHVRAGIQANRTIVVTPAAYLLKDPLIRMVTGCNNPWIGSLAKCAAPSVPKLSGKVGP